MGDQAQRLREIARQQKFAPIARDAEKKSQVYCITSGKGGVGKTSFSVNLAIALSRCGKKVVIIDADFGFSNVNILMGTNSKYNMSHVLNGEKMLNEVMEECFPNVWHISGGAGMADLLKIDHARLAQAMRQMAQLEQNADYILIDTGAGMNDVVLRMISASDHTIIVMTAEPTSLIDSYVVLKMAAALPEKPDIWTIVNKASSEAEAQKTFDSFYKVAQKHLKYDVSMMGYLPRDNRMTNSISALVPFVMQYPSSPLSLRIQSMANVVSKVEAEKAKGIKSFFTKFWKG
ncbi:MAG TPA: hypothetical protein DEB31_01865 [Clostridiales bacterium]|nr:hypothetical protein [Clostridiales bacterium]